MMDEIRGPWDIQVVERLKLGSKEIELVRDDIILDWLRQGDTRPYCDWVLNRKHRPSMRVLEAIAFMMLRATEGNLEAKYDAQYPYSLKVGNRAANRKKNPETQIMHSLIGSNVAGMIDGGMKYEAAVATIRESLNEDGVKISKRLDIWRHRHKLRTSPSCLW